MSLVFKCYQIEFRTVEAEDIEQLRQWRNRDDIRLMMVDQSLITPEQQQAWFAGLNKRQDRHHFSLWFRSELIGYANVQMSDSTASTGLYIGHEKYRGSMLAMCVGVALSEWCFEELDVTEIKAQVAPHNQAALRFNNALGYHESSQDQDWIYLSKNVEQFRQAVEKLMPVLVRFA